MTERTGNPFQANIILGHPLHVALIVVPTLIQAFFNSSLAIQMQAQKPNLMSSFRASWVKSG